jgi:hypothetical protein
MGEPRWLNLSDLNPEGRPSVFLGFWFLHQTEAYSPFTFSPRLGASAAKKSIGKTRALKVWFSVEAAAWRWVARCDRNWLALALPCPEDAVSGERG